MSDHIFDSPESLDAALAHWVIEQLSEAITARGAASLVVSGGSTPKGLFSLLAQAPLHWEKVTVLLADERWVAPDHEDSNEALVKANLLTANAAKANWLSLIPDYPDEAGNLASVSDALAGLNTFDVVILGMGMDAHTASMHPCSAQVNEALTTEADVLMTEPQTAPHRRVTLSRKRLADTRNGLLHIVGDDKRALLESLGDTPTSEAPITAFTRDSGFFVWWAPKH